MGQLKTVLPDGVKDVNSNEGIILDVRTKMEHREKRLVCGHVLLTLDELQPNDFMMRHGYDKDFGVYILCRSGKRAAQAAEQFMAAGYNNVHVIEGGILACEKKGHAVEGHTKKNRGNASGKSPLSLERQVRIAAGAIAAIGAILGLTVSSVFTIIPLFVGAGLVFAGVTDRCGMALVLTKAPWNKTSDKTCGNESCALPPSKSGDASKGQSCQ
ncbi:MAG: rhodanese-like domain-containing protein [Alphaproteobacteria bacterium]